MDRSLERKYSKTLTRDEADRAIYIDFEGREEKPPSLVGVLVDNVYSAIILNPEFKSVAENRKLFEQPLEQFVTDTLSTACRERRVIVAWSEHELNTMQEFNDGTLEERYRNANKLVKNFFKTKPTFKKLKKEIKKSAKWNKNKVGLKDLLWLDYVKYVYPTHLKSFSPAKAISRMEDQLAKYSDYLKVSPGTKRSFSNLITYNEHDCRGMSHLIDYVFSRKPKDTKIEH